MKLTTIALATALALTSSAALGSYMNQPTWSNTGPAAPLPSSPALAPIPTPAPIIRMSGVRR